MRTSGQDLTSNHTPRLAALVLAAAVALGACAKRDNARNDTAGASTGAMMGTRDTGSRSDTSVSAGTAGGAATAAMSDANILALIGISNANEIGASQIALEKGTNPNVKAFARDMVKDHTAMQGDADAVAKRLKISPTPPTGAGNAMKAMAMAMADSLKAAPKGVAFDTLYVRGQVAAHQRTLDDLQRFLTMTSNADVKSLITRSVPKVQTHLDRARQLQTQLSTRS
jgi:putative membrane protein